MVPFVGRWFSPPRPLRTCRLTTTTSNVSDKSESLQSEYSPSLDGVRKAHETYRRWKASQGQLENRVANTFYDTRSQSNKKRLLDAWIKVSHKKSIDTLSLIEAASKAHEILEDLDVRLGQHTGKKTVDEVPAVENTNILSLAFPVLRAWALSVHRLRLDAQTRNDPSLRRSTRGLPQRAQSLLNQLENLSAETLPVEYYNTLLEVWACSNEPLRATEADKVFRRINWMNLSPSSYHWIVRAWTWSSDYQAAPHATYHLKRRIEKQMKFPDDNMEPPLEDYEIVFDAWTRSPAKKAPIAAMSLWNLYRDAVQASATSVSPSLKIFRSILQTAAKRPEWPDLGIKVADVLMARMKDEFIRPDTACYEYAICIWKNCALHEENFDKRPQCLNRVSALLDDMRNAYVRSNADGSIIVTTAALNHVLESLQVSEHSQRGVIAEDILKSMEESLQSGDQQIAPNLDSYRHAINVYRTIKSPDRIPRAKAILLQCKDNLLQGDVDEMTKTSATAVLNSFVLVCGAKPIPISSETGLTYLREALNAVIRFRTEKIISANKDTYTYLLQAARELVGQSESGMKLIEQIFHLACQEGVVDKSLIKQILKVTTNEQYLRLVLSKSQIIDGLKVLPESWSRNVPRGRGSGRKKIKALTIYGHWAETKEMKEWKFRRLRDHRNRDLLTGGRWDTSWDSHRSNR